MTACKVTVATVEQLMLAEFRLQPFHNLFFLGVHTRGEQLTGGTCSEKTLAFKHTLQAYGITAHLHQALIQGQECHRLLSIELEGELHYCDIGNGWPSVRLFPAFRDTAYSAYGIGFEGRVEANGLAIYQTTRGHRVNSVFIPHQARPETEIEQAIAQRFTSGIDYPFANKLRFACITGDEFVFLRECCLQRFSLDGGYSEVVFSDRQEALGWVERFKLQGKSE